MKNIIVALIVLFAVPSFGQDTKNPYEYDPHLQGVLDSCQKKYEFLGVLLSYDADPMRIMNAVNGYIEKNKNVAQDLILCLRVKMVYRYSSRHSQTFYRDLGQIIASYEKMYPLNSAPSAADTERR